MLMVFFIRLKLKVFGRVKACVIYWNNDSINSLWIYGIKVFLPIMILVSIWISAYFLFSLGIMNLPFHLAILGMEQPLFLRNCDTTFPFGSLG